MSFRLNRDIVYAVVCAASLLGAAFLASVRLQGLSSEMADVVAFLVLLITANCSARAIFRSRLSDRALRRWATVTDLTYYASAAAGILLYFGADEANRSAAISAFDRYRNTAEINALAEKEQQATATFGSLEEHRLKAASQTVASLKSAWQASSRLCDDLPRFLFVNGGYWPLDPTQPNSPTLAQAIDTSRDPIEVFRNSRNPVDRAVYVRINTFRSGYRELTIQAWQACYYQNRIDNALLALGDQLPIQAVGRVTSHDGSVNLQPSDVAGVAAELEEVRRNFPILEPSFAAFSGYEDRIRDRRLLDEDRAQLRVLPKAAEANVEPAAIPILSFLRYKDWVFAALLALSLKLTPPLQSLASEGFKAVQGSGRKAA
jgi:hypothetical protein